MTNRPDNPFRITKSNDLTDEQIEQLWVSVTEDDGITGLARPASPTAMYILGGKGSGKSHLLRYYSFPLQTIRYKKSSRNLAEGIKTDGYVGIYARCGGMDSNRFDGKTLTEEKWSALFAYYFELWIADKTLAAIEHLVEDGLVLPEVDAVIAGEITELLDKQTTVFGSISKAREFFSDVRRNLDYSVNNAAFTNQIDAEILVTRGRLFFGLPKIFSAHIEFLNKVVFVYLLDEFENFAVTRQIYINTLLRERDGPVAFRIGSRLYGIRSLQTLSGGERNLRDSEYEELFLDERFRHNQTKYREFSHKLISRRLDPLTDKRPSDPNNTHLTDFFDRPDMEWNSSYFLDAIEGDEPSERGHLVKLREKLRKGADEGLVTGVRTAADIDRVINAVSFPEHPILEKLCILHVFQRWYRSADVADAAQAIRGRALAKIAGGKDKKFDEFVDKHKSDMIAQWCRENEKKQVYAGLDSFIAMSEGLPRALVTILKHVYDWATYTGEDPFRLGKISVPSQQRGVTEAAALFLEQMLPDGEEGIRIGKAIERLCALFRANRFSDKPIETSLIAFSVDHMALSPEARKMLDLATKTSLIISIERGQRERNSMSVTSKMQINRMLSPRWDLPIARRGVVPLKPREVESIFIAERQDEFDSFAKSWSNKMTAPSFGRTPDRRKRRRFQPDLFE